MDNRVDLSERPVFQWSFLLPRYWGTWVLLALIGACTLLPRPVSLSIGASLGGLFYKVNKKRRRIARINLAICFPQMTDEQREKLLRNHYKRYGQNIIDTGLIWWASEQRLKNLVDIDGLPAYLELFEQGHNVILITPHAVGMDLAGVIVSGYHKSISMMKPLYNKVLDWQIRKGRLRYPQSRMVLRDQGIRKLISAIKNNFACYYIPDEDFGADKSVFVPFFGVPTATLPVLGRMARMTNAKVVPCFAKLQADGRYKITLKPFLTEFPSGDENTDAARMNEALEAGIKEAPEQYMWTLRWFKTRPDGAPSPYLDC